MQVYGGIEAGGTKFVCAVGDASGELLERLEYATTAPYETLHRAVDFFRQQKRALGAVGVACFGPLDLRPASRTYGHITSTPKPGWSNTDVLGPLLQGLGVPVGFDTDVNGAALAEHRWGAACGLDTFVYLTIGTGIGGGGMVGGKLLHGLLHPEMGHLRVPHDRDADPFEGTCPFHGDCWEGLACGPALAERSGMEASVLPDDHPAWVLEANYLALGLVSIICILSPQRVIIGGGVMRRAVLLHLVRKRVVQLLAGYLPLPALGSHVDEYIVPPALGENAGVLGAIALAERAARQAEPQL